MKEEEIITKVTEIIREVLKNDQLVLDENQDLSELDSWDSLAQVSIVSKIEKEFSIRFKLMELGRLKDYSDMISIIESKL